MAVFSKILTMLRGDVRSIGQSIVDNNANTIYEQEIIEAKAHVATARQDLTGVMAKEMQATREIERLGKEMTRYEGLALEALQKWRARWPTSKRHWPNRLPPATNSPAISRA
jgi:phage shock protein A